MIAMIDRRHFNRMDCNASCLLTICDANKIEIRNGTPVTGKMIDFSRHGACLLPDEILYGCQHIFTSTQHNKDFIVKLKFILDDQNNSLIIYGNSAWYNQSYFDKADKVQFKLGIEFLKDQDQDTLQKFYVKMANHEGAREGWFKKLFS